MRKKIGIGFAVVISLVLGCAGWIAFGNHKRLHQVYDVALPDLGTPSADVALGQRIAHVRNGCVDCHGKDLGGAVFINDPAMGTFAGANLTPYNLKDWTDAEIARAIHNGVHKTGRPLVFMPSQEFAGLSQDDVKALIAYLRTLPPVAKPNQGYKLGPVGHALLGFNAAPMLAAEIVDHKAPYPDKPAEEVGATFGRYLAKSACVGCHGTSLTGGPIPGGDPSWPPAADLTPRALATWSEQDFIRAMKEGVSKNGQAIRPPMPLQLTAQMSELELRSLWLFLRDLPAPNASQRAH